MYIGKLVFSQIIDHLPVHTFRRCVQRYRGNRKIIRFSCLDQYLCRAFAQPTYRESLRDKVFYGTTQNAVKTQIWIAVSVYVLVAIIKKRLRLEANRYTISTDFKCHHFSKNVVITSTYQFQLHYRGLWNS